MSPYLPLLWTHNSDATTYTRIAGNKIVKFEKEKQTNKKTFRFVEHVDFEVKEGPTTEKQFGCTKYINTLLRKVLPHNLEAFPSIWSHCLSFFLLETQLN